MKRRTFLKVLGGVGAASIVNGPLFQAFGDATPPDGEFFVFIHASGGWDVTLWSDPRTRKAKYVDPASTDNLDTALLAPHWVDAPALNGVTSYVPIRKGNLTLGPGIGSLADHYDRLCIVNGLAMQTVSHPDGLTFSATGRHIAGGRAVASSIDTMIGNELGLGQLFPVVSVQFPSSFIGGALDARATPLRVSSVGTISKSLSRSTAYDTSEDRDAVTVLLSEEARDLAAQSYDPTTMNAFGLQFESLRKMLGGGLQQIFSSTALKAAHPEFDYLNRYQGANAINAAFAVEAMKRNVVRCVSFALGGFDTHNGNYRFQGAIQQGAFNMIATLLATLDATPHPTKSGAKLGDHTHILVVSDFCRTPQINVAGGRDHQPNNSALVISPRFKGNLQFGSTFDPNKQTADEDQLLPTDVKNTFSDGDRPIGPPDLLTTFVSAFGIDSKKYLRDGEVVKALLV